jgi:hypothetical protein
MGQCVRLLCTPTTFPGLRGVNTAGICRGSDAGRSDARPGARRLDVALRRPCQQLSGFLLRHGNPRQSQETQVPGRPRSAVCAIARITFCFKAARPPHYCSDPSAERASLPRDEPSNR